MGRTKPVIVRLLAISLLVMIPASVRANELTVAACDAMLERATAELRAGSTASAQRYRAGLQKCRAIYKADLQRKVADGVVQAEKIIADYEASRPAADAAKPSIK